MLFQWEQNTLIPILDLSNNYEKTFTLFTKKLIGIQAKISNKKGLLKGN